MELSATFFMTLARSSDTARVLSTVHVCVIDAMYVLSWIYLKSCRVVPAGLPQIACLWWQFRLSRLHPLRKGGNSQSWQSREEALHCNAVNLALLHHIFIIYHAAGIDGHCAV